MRPLTSAAFLVLLSLPIVCRAQALADHIPADAMVYVGWNGADNLGPGYEGSHLQAVLNRSEFPKLVKEALPAAFARIAKQEPDAGKYLELVSLIGGPLWTHPSAFYFGGLDLTDPDHPNPRLAILCDAGDDDVVMMQKIGTLIQLAGDNLPLKINVKSFGTLVVVSTFDWAGLPDHPLSDDVTFKQTLSQVSGDCVTAAYFNFEKIVAQIDQFVAVSKDADAAKTWPKIRDSLGLPGFRQLIVTDSFANRDFVTQIFLSAPAPRVGLAALFDGDALDDNFLKTIPRSSPFAAATRLDLAKIYGEVRRGMVAASPQMVTQFDQSVEQMNTTLGMDVQGDLLNVLGSQWAAYTTPEIGDGGLCGIIVNRPNDSAHLETSLTKLEQIANGNLDAAIHPMLPLMTVEIRQQKYKGHTIHFAALPIITPAWTMADGNWYLGLYPQTVASAAQITHDSNGASILDNPDYQDVRKRLGGPDGVSAMAFTDTPLLASRGYGNLLLISRFVLGGGDLIGLESPAMVVPPLSDITPDLEPEGEIAWADAAGFHAKAIQAFPGDRLLTADSSAAMSIIQMLSALAPSLQNMAF